MLWQTHNLRPEEFEAMPQRMKLFYIASELVEMEKPVRKDTWKGGL